MCAEVVEGFGRRQRKGPKTPMDLVQEANEAIGYGRRLLSVALAMQETGIESIEIDGVGRHREAFGGLVRSYWYATQDAWQKQSSHDPFSESD